MIQKIAFKNLDWIDLESPTRADIDEIRTEYGIHDFVANELHKPTLKPRVDFYDHHIYCILHFPIFDSIANRIHTREIDFVLGKKFLITAHYEDISPLHELADIFKLGENDEYPHPKTHAGYLFFYIMQHLYSSLEKELSIIGNEIEHAEDDVFRGKEREMVQYLSVIGRHILDFARTLKSHREILLSFESASIKFFGSEYAHYASAVSAEYYKIWNALETHKEILHDLRSTNDSLLTTKTNETIKFLTIMAFITFPLTLIAGIFGMNTAHTPFVDEEFGFWIIVGIMCLSTVIFFSFFKYRKWL